MHILHSGRDFTQHRYFARQTIDIGHGEIDFRLMRRSQKVQYRVGGTAHGDIQHDGVFKAFETGHRTRPGGFVVVFVMAFA